MRKIIEPKSSSSNTLQITLQQQNQSITITNDLTAEVNYYDCSDEIHLKACGRNGKDGLVGRDGRNGKPGRPGLDATQTSDAGRGSDGEDGEPGELGSHGEDAGNGGEVIVNISEEDLALLPLINSVDISPGKPGRAGRHGQGGKGGAGGPGGRGIQWQTTRTVWEKEEYQPPQEKRPIHKHHHTHGHFGHGSGHFGHGSQHFGHGSGHFGHESQHFGHGRHDHSESSHRHGHDDFEQEYEYYWPPKQTRDVKKTVVDHHSRPGGSDGRAGRSGDTPCSTLRSGKHGETGRYFIHVNDYKGNRLSIHSKPYKLFLSYASGTRTVVEPGELVRFSYEILNEGPTMISPKEAMPLRFHPSNYFTIDQQEAVKASGSIEPKKTQIVTQEIRFNSSKHVPDKYAYEETCYLTVDLMNSRLKTPFASVSHPMTLRYPVKLSYTNQVFHVQNIVDYPLGLAVQRAIQLHIKTSHDKTIDIYPIDTLEKGAPYSLALQEIKFGPCLWFKQWVAYAVDLYLQPINQGELIPIQRIPIKVGNMFQLKLSCENTTSKHFYEPGEVVDLQYAVKNTSPTQTSPDENMQLQFDDSANIQVKKTIAINGNIGSGQRICPKEMATIQFQRPPHAGKMPFEEEWVLKARLTSKTGEYDELKHYFKVKYPLTMALENVEFHTAFGETTPLEVSVTNIADYSIKQRAIQLTITDENQKLIDTYTCDSVASNDHVTYAKALLLSESNESVFKKPATYYVSLYLQPLNQTDTLTLIQRQIFTNNVCMTYQQAGHFTLVVNNTVEPAIKQRWQNFIYELSGKHPAMYDASYYGSDKNAARRLTLNDLMQHNRYGTVLMLANTSFNDSVDAQFLLDSYQQHHATLITTASVQALPSSYSRVAIPACVSINSRDRLIQALLDEANESFTSYKLRKSIRSSARLDRAVNDLQNVLNRTFPNRRYQVTFERVEGGKQVDLIVHRLADPTYGRAIRMMSRASTRESEEELMKHLPFGQKLNFFVNIAAQNLGHANHDSNQPHLSQNQNEAHSAQEGHPESYQKVLSKSIQQEVIEEQRRLSRTQAYGSFWQKRGKTFNQSQTDMRHLESLIQCSRNLVLRLSQFHTENDVHAFNAWVPFVKKLLETVKAHAEASITWRDKFFHFFSPQGKVIVARGAIAKCNEGLSLCGTKAIARKV